MKKLLFVFRDPARRGHSVEELYQGIMPQLRDHFLVSSYAFDDKLSWKTNIDNIKNMKPDLVHVTSDMYQYIPFMPGKKFMTLHDLGYFKGLKGWKKQIYKFMWLYLPAKVCHRVVTVSNYTREEFRKVFGNKLTEKLQVIHNPVHPLFSFYPKKFSSEKPIILHVGTGVHKNLPSLIEALKGLDVTLHIIGRVSEETKDLILKNDVSHRTFENLTYLEVVEKYKAADIISFVSLHEGFGMPVIEAQAIGRPVITSNLCSLPEVGGKGAIYINDPLDIKEIRRAIEQLINDWKLRNELVKEGLENVKNFSMDKIITQYRSLYEA